MCVCECVAVADVDLGRFLDVHLPARAHTPCMYNHTPQNIHTCLHAHACLSLHVHICCCMRTCARTVRRTYRCSFLFRCQRLWPDDVPREVCRSDNNYVLQTAQLRQLWLARVIVSESPNNNREVRIQCVLLECGVGADAGGIYDLGHVRLEAQVKGLSVKVEACRGVHGIGLVGVGRPPAVSLFGGEELQSVDGQRGTREGV